ncbi:hypothetical protein HYH03_018770 [Edaphochlamys debaryana]|uniref:Pentacotripeptide-repeat region of PRORP domain-containing protein n=1 Tax=Edaphochlamys debaryana TaxID=47281 RepID=A0A835XJK3_9CHLO|nr:hypothetical protein HYH03_018770 [Edaphochlamys debaryana]|eukprot:KAG2482285.1 hypothetical protein HYH03_018770 [Edaphochlamys debaryana]
MGRNEPAGSSDAQSADALAAARFRARELARKTVDYHRAREAERRFRDRPARRHAPFPWAAAAEAVLADEAVEDEATAVALIKELGEQGCSELALAALDLLLSRGPPLAPPSRPLLDAALGVCALEAQDGRCMELYGRMQALGLPPDLGSANLVLTALCVRGRLEAAVGVLAGLRGAGVAPNTYSVLMLLQACNFKRRGAYREAIEAVQSLEAGGRPASEEVIEALLQVCEAAMHKAPSFEAALSVFEALSGLQLADSTRAYNALLGAAGRCGRWREAQALYAAMAADEVPPSLETHTALIQACVVGRALDHALDIFEYLVAGRAAHEAVPASIATYNHLIHACHQAGMLEKALEIAAWVQRSGVAFDADTYTELLGTIEVAQLWDAKALRGALAGGAPALLPGHLRPAPYDAMRVMYLDHLDALQQEELLALEKLGPGGSWASRSLTRGALGLGLDPGEPSGGYAPHMPHQHQPYAGGPAGAASLETLGLGGPASARGPGGGGTTEQGGMEMEPSGPQGPGPMWGPHGPGLGAHSSSGGAVSSRELIAALRASVSAAVSEAGGVGTASGGAGVPAAAAAAAAVPLRRRLPLALSRAPSMRALLGSLSVRRNSVGQAGLGTFRAGGSSSIPAPPAPAAPTGFYDPPSWAQAQVVDSATAGPGGTPFLAYTAQAYPAQPYPQYAPQQQAQAQAQQGPGPGATAQGLQGASSGALAPGFVPPLPLPALEAANAPLYGGASATSLAHAPGSATARGSARGPGPGYGSFGGAGGSGGGGPGSSPLRSSGLVAAAAALASQCSGSLPRLADPLAGPGPGMGPGAALGSPRAPSGLGPGSARPAKGGSGLRVGVLGLGPSGPEADFVPSPLPVLAHSGGPHGAQGGPGGAGPGLAGRRFAALQPMAQPTASAGV